MRIAAAVEYCGTAYLGWQRQDGGSSVQGCVETALTAVADSDIRVHCAGRTDSGVHAVHQVLHFDTQAQRADHSWVFGANVHLPHDISLLWALRVDETFHARFSATARCYRYVLLNRRARAGLLARLTGWECRPLDAGAMAAAAAHFIGQHDFSAFRAAGCQAKTPVREVRRFEVRRRGDFIIFDVEANAFLHHMVRNMVGLLIEIGLGRYPAEHVARVLASLDRSSGGPTAPAAGLYLVDILYPDRYQIPAGVQNGWPFELAGWAARSKGTFPGAMRAW